MLYGVQLSDAGSYFVQISGICSPDAFSDTVEILLQTPPVITQSPLSQAACVGDTVVFAVSANGTNLQYQWRKDGIPIAGATEPILRLEGVTDTDAGLYDVIVSGTCPPDTVSAPAELTINQPPRIVQHPESDTLCLGDQLVLQVVAEGTDLHYQWRKDGIPITGATDPVYVVNSATLADTGTYDVIISGACDPVVQSQSAHIALSLPFEISAVEDFPPLQCRGETAIASITLFNPAAIDLPMEAPIVSNTAQFQIITPNVANGFTIPARSSITIQVQHQSLKAGFASTTIDFRSVRCNEHQQVTLQARSDSVSLSFTPLVEFNTIAQCDPPARFVDTLENTGDTPLLITAITFSDPTHFRLVSPSVPFSVAPGERQAITIEFDGQGTAGNYTEMMYIAAEPCNYTRAVQLHARSIQIDYFAQIPNDVLDFGQLDGCQSDTVLSFPLVNNSDIPVIIAQVTSSHPDFSVLNLSAGSVLPPDTTITVWIRYVGSTPGVATGTIRIENTRCPDVAVELTVKGERLSAVAGVTPAQVDFGRVLGCGNSLRDTTVTVINNGTDHLTLARPILSSPFQLLSPPPGIFPITLPPGDTLALTIQFSASTPNVYTQTMLIPYAAGSCHDSLRITLAGSYVEPRVQLSAESVDFGTLLECDSFRDTLLTITNPSTLQLRLVNFTASMDFALLTPYPLTIEPGESRTVRIRYRPLSTGTHAVTAQLLFEVESCTLMQTLRLTGKKTGVTFTVTPTAVQFDPVVDCQVTEDPAVQLTLDGSTNQAFTGSIASYQISGPFYTDLQLNDTINSQSPLHFRVWFDVSAATLGNNTGTLQIILNPCDYTIEIPLEGRLETAQAFAPPILLFPTIYVDDAPITTATYFHNTGTVPLRIDSLLPLSPPFRIVGTLPPLPAIIAPDDSLEVLIEFAPTVAGTYRDTLQYKTADPCTLEFATQLVAEATNAPRPVIIVTSPASLLIDFGDVMVTQQSPIRSITIKNVGKAPGKIQNPILSPATGEFVITDFTPDITLNVGDSITIGVFFAPQTVGPKNAQLTFLTTGGTPTIQLQGHGIPLPEATVGLALPTISAPIGSRNVQIPISLIAADRLSEIRHIRSVTLTLRFRGTIFYPYTVTRGRILSSVLLPNYDRVVTIQLTDQDLPSLPTPPMTLTTLVGEALFGDATGTPLFIDSVRWDVELGSVQNTILTPGYLSLTGICEAGGRRLIRLHNNFGITDVHPDPAHTEMTVVVELIGNRGTATLRLVGISGKTYFVRQWDLSRTASNGYAYEVIRIPVQQIPSGSYFFLLESPNRIDKKQVRIIK